MFSTLLGVLGIDLKREMRGAVITIVLGLSGGLLALLAVVIALRAFYLWLELQLGLFPALGILGGLAALLAVVLLWLAFRRPRPTPPRQKENPLKASAAALAEAGEHVMSEATDSVRHGSRKQMYSTIVIATLAGLILGRRL